MYLNISGIQFLIVRQHANLKAHDNFDRHRIQTDQCQCGDMVNNLIQ